MWNTLFYMFGSSAAETSAAISAALLLTVRSIHRLILKIKNKSNKPGRNDVEYAFSTFGFNSLAFRTRSHTLISPPIQSSD